jgi:hypothetical protein
MAAKKKRDDSTSMNALMSPENAIVLQGYGNSNNDNIFVNNIAEGALKVNVHDLGISPKDIEAKQRIDARLAEVQKTWQAALVVGLSAP